MIVRFGVSTVLLLLSLVGCTDRAQENAPPEAPESAAQAEARRRSEVEERVRGYWSLTDMLLRSPRYRDPAPPKGAVRVDAQGQRIKVDYEQILSTLEPNAEPNTSEPDVQLRYAYRPLLEKVAAHPQHEHAEVWVAAHTESEALARTLVTLKQAGVKHTHLAVQDLKSHHRGWMVLEDVRVFDEESRDSVFALEELMPWEVFKGLAPRLVALCQGTGSERCSRPRGTYPPPTVTWIELAFTGRYWVSASTHPEGEGGELAAYVFEYRDNEPVFARSFQALATQPPFGLQLALPTEGWGLVLGTMYPDGKKMPPIAVSMDKQRWERIRERGL